MFLFDTELRVQSNSIQGTYSIFRRLCNDWVLRYPLIACVSIVILCLEDIYLCLLPCVLSLILFIECPSLFFMIFLLSVIKTSRIKFHARVILFVGFFVEFICNWRCVMSYEILREDVRTFCIRFLIMKNIIISLPLFFIEQLYL